MEVYTAPVIKASPTNLQPSAHSWPAWTDESRWTIAESDEPRPTAGPDFIPTPEECDEAAALLNDDDEHSDAYWDARAEDALFLDLACAGLSY